MALVRFPDTPDYPEVLRALAEAGAFEPHLSSVTFRFGRGRVPAAACALLAAWSRAARARGVFITSDGPRATLAALDRLGVGAALGRAPSVLSGAPSLFVPVRFIENGDDVYEATNAVLDLVLHEFADARPFLPALEWAMNEVIDNVQVHAEAPVPGAVCARIDPRTRILDVGIVDMGRGIRASLGPVLEPWESHGDAIQKAVQRGVTRDHAIGQGNGLAGTLAIASLNEGDFSLWTGDAVFRLRRGRDVGFEPLLAAVPGTGAAFRLNPHRPVNLADTFIGAPTYTYLEATADQVAEAGGLLVIDEVPNTGTRAAGRRLRTKALNVLPDLEGPLTLNFGGVERASSSFLDELVGRLVAALGTEAFRERVRLVNLAPHLLDMANVVTAQRMDQEGLA